MSNANEFIIISSCYKKDIFSTELFWDVLEKYGEINYI